MEPFDHIVDCETDISTICLILTSKKCPLVRENWETFLKLLGVEDLIEYRRKMNEGTYTVTDVIDQGIKAWHGDQSENAKLSTILNILEENIGAKNTGEKLRLEFDLPCYKYEKKPNLGWADLGEAFQKKVTNVLKNVYKVDITDVDTNELTPSLLAALMTNGKPKLFKDLPSKWPYHIVRHFAPKNVLCCKKISEQNNIPDIFLFQGLTSEELEEKIPGKSVSKSTYQLNHLQDNSISDRFIVFDSGLTEVQVESQFKRICAKTEQQLPVHWVRYRADKDIAELVKSKGKMDTIQQCLHDLSSTVDEKQLINKANNQLYHPPTIISGNLGMGKSMTLAYLASKLVESQGPQKRYVSLATVTELVRIVKKVGWDDPSIIQKAVEELVCENELGKVSLKAQMKSETITFQLLLDGFDEVPDGDRDLVIKILSAITAQPSFQLWITTRPHKVLELENALNVLSHIMLPFCREDELTFLINYWTKHSEKDPQISKELIKKNLRTFADSCLLQLATLPQLEIYDMAKSPLSCLLIAEIFKTNAAEFITNTPSGKLKISSIASLYDRLVTDRFRSYLSTGENTKMKEKEIVLIHATWAMHVFFPAYKTLIDSWNPKDKPFQQEILLKIGLVEKDRDSLRFIHSSFAAYFIALLTVRLKQRFSGLKCISSASSSLLLDDDQSIRLLDLIFKDLPMTLEKDGTTTPSRFTQSGIRFFINSILAEAEGKIKLRNLRRFLDTFSNPTVIKSIAIACVNDQLYCIFKEFYKKNAFDMYTKEIFDDEFLLATVSSSSSFEFTKLIYPLYLKNYKFEGSVRTQVLQKLVQNGDFYTLSFLVNEAKAFNYLKYENTILHDCVPVSNDIGSKIKGKLKILGILLKINKNLVNVEHNDGLTPLMRLVKNMDPSPETLGLFKNAEADLNYKNDGLSILAVAIKSGRSSATIKNLIECGSDPEWISDNGANLFHIAAESGNFEAVMQLLEWYEQKVNLIDVVNLKDRSPEELTPLEYAIRSNAEDYSGKRLNVGIKLREKGGTFRDGLNNKQTWLHVVAGCGNYDSIRLLLRLGVKINQKDASDNTALHLALMISSPQVRWDVVRLLRNNGSDVNSIGETALSLALKNPTIDWETFRLLKSKTVGWKSKEEATLGLKLFLANSTHLKDEKFIKYVERFVAGEADLNSQNDQKQTILHKSVNGIEDVGLSLRTIKFLIRKGTNVTLTDNQDMTFLNDLMAKGLSPSQLDEFVKFLSAEKIINASNAEDSKFLNTLLPLAMPKLEVKQSTLKLLQCMKVDFSLLGRYQQSLLHIAAKTGNVTALQFLLELSSLEVNGKDEFGNTPLHYAVFYCEINFIEIVMLLTENGADPDLPNDPPASVTPKSIANWKYPYIYKELGFGED